jgi:outer membrane protein assembly factor BamD (BamD/ComL family)
MHPDRYTRCAFVLVIALVIGLSGAAAAADSARSLYAKGKDRLDDGNGDMALMYFRELIRDYPESRYAVEAHFLIARYYNDSHNYFQADRQLREHQQLYPKSPYAEQVQAMLSELEVVNLEAKALKAMENGEYRVAQVLWEDVLAKNPNHVAATRNLAECNRVIERMDYQKRQLERDKERIEAESKAIAKLLEDARQQREQAERIRAEAEQMDANTRAKYEAALTEANRLSEELEQRIRDLEADLKLWRDRARKYEARLLQEPDIGPLEGIAVGQELPKVIFEGPEPDPSPETGEEQVAGMLVDASPSVVLVAEYLNRETSMLKAEVVASVDLTQAWPKDDKHLLKVRIEFQALALDDGTRPTIPSKTIYYSLSEMDDVDTRNCAYRKKVIIAVDKNTIDTYSVAAYFVRKK